MANTAVVVYQGQLRTKAKHLRSGQVIITDAPTDNHGRGQAFSPTDLVSAALISCMQTILGIMMNEGRLPELQLSGEVLKVMAANPRRISVLEVEMTVTSTTPLAPETRQLLENTARTCPVAQSLHPDIQQIIRFIYQTTHAPN